MYFEERTSNCSREKAVAPVQLAISALPEAERLYLLTAKPTLLHWGCGFGEGAGEISRIFPDVRVSGLDFAAAATDRARANYPDLEFLPSPEGHIPREFDVIIVSERLAHFSQPLELAAEHLASCRMLYAVVVPHNEWPLEPSHRSQFRDESFPPRIGRFRRIHLARLIPDPAVSNREQILALYASPEYLATRTHWDAAATEQRKWTEYYQSLDQEEPPEVAHSGKSSGAISITYCPKADACWRQDAAPAGRASHLRAQDGIKSICWIFLPRPWKRHSASSTPQVWRPGFRLATPSPKGSPNTTWSSTLVCGGITLGTAGPAARGMGSRSKKYVICLAPNRNCYWYWISRVRSAAEGQWPFGKESPPD